MIRERSGSEFDSVYGPIFVCVALIVALCLNFGLQVRTLTLQYGIVTLCSLLLTFLSVNSSLTDQSESRADTVSVGLV